MNPFTYGTVATGESFYDRDKECDHIVKTLAGGNNIVMYAPRRFGKTSLVIKAIQNCRNKASLAYILTSCPFSQQNLLFGYIPNHLLNNRAIYKVRFHL